MYNKLKRIYFFLSIALCTFSCERQTIKVPYQKGEYIYRIASERLFTLTAPERKNLAPYPWEVDNQQKFSCITNEHFRCKGTSLHSAKIINKGFGDTYLYDCDGIEEHSLPIKDGKEYIYPILIELLNAIQNKLAGKVIITAGHRCLDHHLYVTDGQGTRHSKHLMGAEVTFYVEGFEHKPQSVVDFLLQYYRDNPTYAGASAYTEFKRWDLEKTDVSTAPWYNQEIFIKLYNKYEGRDGDNSHGYPYIGLQVRWERSSKEKVRFIPEKDSKNCWRKR